ncbi:MAG: twin-arginine translocase TatA/TatE family subunit [Opitutaceae bacterium]|jgi:sec-independent protein translocase protein TatA|nr:twin-arginine translocase TatA/TatE family subunit [Opitutaceae bacterium]
MFSAIASLATFSPVAPALAVFEGIGAMEMLLVAVVGLLLFGGKGLPDMARTVGKMVREFKKATQGVEDEVRRVMHEEPAPPPRPRPRPAPAQALPPPPIAPAPASTPDAPSPSTDAPPSPPRSEP